MADHVLVCDHAIFTSVRTPMGEGYRIIAASKGLNPEEKQAITRNSPSHESLCPPPDGELDEAIAVSFYQLPGTRVCLALSVTAGAEQSGRGGKRVYTHSVVFEPDALEPLDMNPFALARALCRTGLCEPQLEPPKVLDDLTVETTIEDLVVEDAPRANGAWVEPVLDHLIHKRGTLLNMPGHWLAATELALLSLPLPMRRECTFSAGLKYSVGRERALQVFYDKKKVSKTRSTGRDVIFVDADEPEPVPDPNGWARYAARLCEKGAFNKLQAKAARAYEDVTPDALETLANLFITADEMPDRPVEEVMEQFLTHAGKCAPGPLALAESEVVDVATKELAAQIPHLPWDQVELFWERVCGYYRAGGPAAPRCALLIEVMLAKLAEADPMRAALAALEIVEIPHNKPDAERFDAAVESCLAALIRYFEAGHLVGAEASAENRLEQASSLVTRWTRLRPEKKSVQKLGEIIESVSATASTPSTFQF